jgi:acetyl-CoA carboxylase biotin carboxyl carrier protein
LCNRASWVQPEDTRRDGFHHPSDRKKELSLQLLNIEAIVLIEFTLVGKRRLHVAIVDVKTDITGNVWKIVALPGQTLEEDEPIMILESMKMEIPVASPEDGELIEILVSEGDIVTEGTVVARIKA